MHSRKVVGGGLHCREEERSLGVVEFDTWVESPKRCLDNTLGTGNG